MNLNPRTNKQIHTPAVVQGGGGLMEPLPGVFNTLQCIETISLLVESLCHDLLNKMKYIYGWWRCWRPVTSPAMVATYQVLEIR